VLGDANFTSLSPHNQALRTRIDMGVRYTLVNRTKKEELSFSHLLGSKMRELAGGAATSALVTWYLLKNQGDDIQFVSDTYEDWPFSKGKLEDLSSYQDRTEEYLKQLINEGILQDNGFEFRDEDEPDTVYIKDYENVWPK
jgi:hypothetical protein